jgi:hypothetical protein
MDEKTIQSHFHDRKWRINNLYYVKNEEGKKVLFRMNKVQEYLHDNLWFFNIVPKARQLGITTFFTILYLDQVLFKENQTATIIAHTEKDMKKIFRNKIKFAWDNLHPWLKQTIGDPNTNTANELSFPNGSVISVALSSRSDTVQFLHCLHPEQEVVMYNGFVKRIYDVVAGDYILNGKGSKSLVKHVLKQKTDERMLAIKSFGHYQPLKVTEEHQVLCREYKTGKPVWKSAKQITCGDYVAFPITNPSYKGNYDFALGRMCGLYLAEGSLRKTEMTLSLHRDEVNTVLEWIDMYKEEYKSRRVYFSKKSKTATISINQWNRFDWIVSIFGKGEDKYINSRVFSYSSDFLKGLLYGYLYGDGCFTNNMEISCVSTRRQIVEQIKRLIISLRYGVPSIHYTEGEVRYGRNCKDSWTLKLTGAGNWKFRKEFALLLPVYVSKSAEYRIAHDRCPTERKFWRRGKKVYWLQVTSISEIDKPEYVYDIVLDDEPHSFTTPSGIVHNCSEFGKICAKYPDKAEEIVTGAINSVHAGCMVSIESTAEGREGYFFEFCEKAEKARKEGRELTPLDFKIFFFPWWIDERYVLNGNFAIAREYVDYFNTLESKHKIKLTDEQRRWWVKKKELNGDKMFAEYPSTFDEAFSVSTEGAYYSKEMNRVYLQNRIGHFPLRDDTEVDTWWDLGMNDFNVILFTQTVGPAIYFIDVYYNHGYKLGHYVEVLKEKGYRYGRHVLPHDVEVRDMSSGKTRKQTLYDLGLFNVCVSPKSQHRNDDIERVRGLFSRFYFDEIHTKKLYDSLANYRKEWDARLGVFKDSPRHDENSHFADAVRTGCMVWTEEMQFPNEYEKEQYEKKADQSFFAD